MQHGLDVQHGTQHGGGCADTAAPLQIHQVIHGEPVGGTGLGFLGPGGQLLQGQAGIPLLAYMPHQQALTQGSAAGIHHADLALGILLHQIVGGDDGGLVGSGQAGRKCQHQGILAGGQYGLDEPGPIVGVDGRGGGHFAGAHGIIQGFDLGIGHAVRTGLTAEIHDQRNCADLQLLQHGGGQVAGGIGNDLIHNGISCLGAALAADFPFIIRIPTREVTLFLGETGSPHGRKRTLLAVESWFSAYFLASFRKNRLHHSTIAHKNRLRK